MIGVIVLARGPHVAGQPFAWRAIAWPLAGWHLIDTDFCVGHGVWGYVVLNTATALLFAIPLLASRRHFDEAT